PQGRLSVPHLPSPFTWVAPREAGVHWDLGGKDGPGERMTVGTSGSVTRVLDGLDQHRGEFEELVAARWASVARRFSGQRRVAVGTGFGEDREAAVTLRDQLQKAGLELTHHGTQGGDLGFEFGDTSLEGLAARALRMGRGHTAGVRGRRLLFLPT